MVQEESGRGEGWPRSRGHRQAQGMYSRPGARLAHVCQPASFKHTQRRGKSRVRAPQTEVLWEQPGRAPPPTHLVDARVTLLLLGGCVQAPERREPAPPLAGGPGHGLGSPPHARLACAGRHLGKAGHTGGVRPRTRSPSSSLTSPSNTTPTPGRQHRPCPLRPWHGPWTWR